MRSFLTVMSVLLACCSTRAQVSALDFTADPAVAAEPRPGDQQPADKPARVRSPEGLFVHYWENDGSFQKPNHNTDRYYTDGMAASLTWRSPARQPSDQDALPADLIDHLHAFDDFSRGRRAFGIALGHHIYTASDITVPDPAANDHPYAGYVYLAGFWERWNDQTLDHVEIDVGVVGPASQADDIQAGVHDAFRDQFGGEVPRGWDTQLGDEPVIQFYFRKKWRLGDVPSSAKAGDAAANQNKPDAQGETGPLQFQLIPQLGLALGLAHRHLEGGAMVRVGLNLPDDFGPSRMADLAANGLGAPGRMTAYGFARVGGRIVEHDLFIEGSNFEKSRGAEAETFVGEAQAGVGLSCRLKCVDLHVTFSQTVSTRQFKDQHGTHAIGALTVGFGLRF